MQNFQPTDGSGPVTDEQRAYLIDTLQSTRHSLHQSVGGLSDAQLTYRPAPDRWSVADCVEHIVLVERAIFGAVLKGIERPADPAKRADIHITDVDVIKSVRSRAVTTAAPDLFVPTGVFGDAAGSLRAFDQQRDSTLAFARTITEDLRMHYFRHFVLGWLDSYQALLVLVSHGERHRKQIEEIKASAGFPH